MEMAHCRAGWRLSGNLDACRGAFGGELLLEVGDARLCGRGVVGDEDCYGHIDDLLAGCAGDDAVEVEEQAARLTLVDG